MWWFQSKIAPSAQEEVKNKTCLQQKHASKCLTLLITCWNPFNPLIKQNFLIYFWHISGISFCKFPKSTTSSTLTNCPMSLNDVHPPPFFRMFFFLERFFDSDSMAPTFGHTKNLCLTHLFCPPQNASFCACQVNGYRSRHGLNGFHVTAVCHEKRSLLEKKKV